MKAARRVAALLLLACSGVGRAEEQPARVFVPVLSPIRGIAESEGRRRVVVLDRGTALGLAVGRRGRVLAPRPVGKSRRYGEFLGYAVVEQADETTARVRVTLQRTGGEWDCREGDLVELSVLAPRRERDILFRLAANHILFRGEEENDLYYRLPDLLAGESAEGTAAVLDAMALRIRGAGRDFGDMEALQRRLSSGRYAGRTVGALMREATAREVRDFLRFVDGYPGKYLGKTWRIDETFATWVINGAPYSETELADKIEAAETDEARRALLAQAPALRGEVLGELFRRSRAATDDRAFDRARALLVLAAGLKRAGDEPAATLLLHFGRALLVLRQGDLHQATALFSDTILAYRSAKEVPADLAWIEAFSLHHLGTCLRDRGLYKGAIEAYTEAIARKEAAGIGLESRALTLRHLADLLRDQGKPRRAIEVYDKAIAAFERLDARDELNEAWASRAAAYTRVGRPQRALQDYSRLLHEARDAGDLRGQARAHGWIAAALGAQGRVPAAILEDQKSLRLWKELDDPAGAAGAQDAIAWRFASLRNYPMAIDRNAKARAAYAKAGWKNASQMALADLGVFEAGRGDYAGGLARAEAALAALQEAKHAAGVIYARNAIAKMRFDHFEYELAGAAYAASIDDARKQGARGSLASSLAGRARVRVRLRDFDAARADYVDAIAISHEDGELAAEVGYRLELSDAERLRGEIARAHEEVDAALRLARELGSEVLQARAQRTKGWVWQAAYRLPEAEAAFQEALAIFASPEIQDRATAAAVHYDLAAVRHDRGRWDEAYDTARRGLLHARWAQARDLERSLTLMLGRILMIRGDLDGAGARFDEVAQDESAPVWTQAETWLELARCAQELGAGARARECGRNAETLYGQLRNDWGLASAGLHLSRILLSQGDDEAAARQLEATRVHAARTGDLDLLANVEERAGSLALARGDVAAAAAHLERACETARRMKSATRLTPFLQALGGCRRRQGRLDDARRLLEEAAETYHDMKSSDGEARCRLELTRVALDAGDDDAAKAQLALVEQVAGDTKSTEVIWPYFFLRSRVEERAGDLDRAFESRKRAVSELAALSTGLGADAERQKKFLLSKVDVYESMAELIGKRLEGAKDDAERETLVAELTTFVDRARFEVLRSGAGDVGRTGSAKVDELLGKIRAHDRRSQALRRRMDEAHAEGKHDLAEKLAEVLAENESQLSKLYDDLHAQDEAFASRMKFNPRYFRAWKRLPAEARLVIYFPAPDGLHFMVYGPKGFLVWKKQPEATEEKLRALVLRFHALLGDVAVQSGQARGRGFGEAAEADAGNPAWYRKNCAEVRAVLRQLHDWTIEPVREQIGSAEPLLLMPYASLCYLPFEAVLDRDGSFLGERHTISYLIHRDHLELTLSGLRDPPRRGADYWVAFGDPVGKLRSAMSEVAEIGAMFPRRSVHTRQTGDATEAELLATPGECTILHFATHGYLNGVSPSETYLELARDETHDGRLHQAEIYPALGDTLACLKNERLRLVVLSACDTARGAKDPKAEVLGLPDNLAAVGAPAVVASLWKVDTWSTGSLMAEFYARITKPGTPIGRALREARQALLEDRAAAPYAHPYYWAPFVLFGDWR